VWCGVWRCVLQYKPIRTTRFVVAGTIEERILKLQEKKQAVFEGTVGEWGQDTMHAWCLFTQCVTDSENRSGGILADTRMDCCCCALKRLGQ
jgi:hypothetical protein